MLYEAVKLAESASSSIKTNQASASPLTSAKTRTGTGTRAARSSTSLETTTPRSSASFSVSSTLAPAQRSTWPPLARSPSSAPHQGQSGPRRANDLGGGRRPPVRGAAQAQDLPAELGAQGVPVSDTWANPASQPGGRLYERFVAAWAQVPCKLMRMVFHGTAKANVAAICSATVSTPTGAAGRRWGRANTSASRRPPRSPTVRSAARCSSSSCCSIRRASPPPARASLSSTSRSSSCRSRSSRLNPPSGRGHPPAPGLMWGSYPGFAGVNPFMAAANPFPGLGRALSGAGPTARPQPHRLPSGP